MVARVTRTAASIYTTLPESNAAENRPAHAFIRGQHRPRKKKTKRKDEETKVMTTDDDISTNISEKPPLRPRSRRRVVAGLTIMLAAGALSFSVAQAQGGGADGSGGPHAGAWGGGGFIAGRIARVLDHVGASDAQKAQIKAVWDGLRPQLKAVHDQHRQLRRQISEALAAPAIDTAQVEQLRRQSVQLMDRTSVLITQGMVSSAQVLTPDQRRQALAEMQKHHGRGGGDATE
jgi:protein CpxP